MILVTGRVTAKPDTFAEMLHMSQEHVHRSREEPVVTTCRWAPR